MEFGIFPGHSVRGRGAASGSGATTPRVGWGAMGRMAWRRLAGPEHSCWTAAGASVWGFPHSGEGGGGKRGEEKGRVDKSRGW